MKKLPHDFPFLADMYADDYFPNPQVNKIKVLMIELGNFLESGVTDTGSIQEKLDGIMEKINDLQEEFEENDSEIETVARESIGETVESILQFFEIDIDIEEAIRARDW
jgi:thiamine biosynthesis lipoprotein ApbE